MVEVRGTVRQDVVVGDAANGAASMVPVARFVVMDMDMDMLDCPRCKHPFKPPIFQFQCEAAHLACNKCHAELPKNQCYECGHAGSYSRSVLVEKFIGRVRVLCPYEVFGCQAKVIYNEVEIHERGCSFAPCGCPEWDCRFWDAPPKLRDHVATEHRGSGPVISFRYGVEWNLAMEPAKPWQLLVAAEEGGSVFLASRGELGAGAAVTLVCVRANGGAPAPQYRCRLAMELPAGCGGGGDDGMVAVILSKVPSSAVLYGAPAPDDGVFLGARLDLLAAGTVSLKIRIDPVQVPAADVSF